MSTGKRLLGKRSIIGTRVSVPVTVTGNTIYVPAVIHSTRVLGLETSYCVQFLPNDSELRALLPGRKEYRAEQMVGPGFQSVTQVVDQFCSGQKVFLTFKGREVSGSVVRHERDNNSVLISIHDRKQADSNSLLQHDQSLVNTVSPVIHVRRRLEDMRLLESRKSARLVDSEIDYSKILIQDTGIPAAAGDHHVHHHHRDSDGDPKSSETHNSIIEFSPPELPQQQQQQPGTNTTASTAGPGVAAGTSPHNYSSSSITQGRKRRTSDSAEDLIMDDCSAAMVLMSLSCSPKSPIFFPNNSQNAKYSRSWTPGSIADSGIAFDFPMSDMRKSQINATGLNSETSSSVASNELIIDEGSSFTIPEGQIESASPLSASSNRHHDSDEGIHLVEEMALTVGNNSITGSSYNLSPGVISRRKRIIFQCTWPGCDARYKQNSAIERHVRSVHAVDAGEEEFYYTEHEVRIKSPAAIARIPGSLSPVTSLMSNMFDHGTNSSSISSNSSCADGSSNGSSPSPISSPTAVNAATAAAAAPAGRFTFQGSGTAITAMPTWSHLDMARPAHEDPEYQMQMLQKQQQQQQSGSIPIAIPGLSLAHHTFMPSSKQQQQQQQNHKFMRIGETFQRVSPGSSLLQVSPKSRVGRTRGESRKCRKVYGMESRELWCTQCKWKKACTRFHD